MRLRVALLGGLGGVLTAVAAGLVFVPDLLLGVAPVTVARRTISGIDPTALSILTVLGVLAALAVVSWSPTKPTHRPGDGSESAFDRALAEAPEAVTDDHRRLAAADIDADLTRAVVDGGGQFVAVRESFVETAVTAYADSERVDRARARAAIERGEWTDDRTAAVFLAADEELTPPLRARVRLWLTPERERRRRVDRTLDAIRRLGEGPR